MVRREENWGMEEYRQALLGERNEILEKIASGKEQRIQWLLKFMDIEDELEELSHRKDL
ncbi:hypothetical protein REC12_09185 [Desulfosporosinus sp. PR]|uniref:hypothetical protein n=1 Tax=Candidatus Desulfosporosinus nitrosoreducens TaxID=3401928 RepID=UPI0027EDF05D|nr:hypothetical protein [Desulfosporosinus sp. PR]MDQ7093764.1 hypothetical protein [Desulfosporosinus sp. PR]